MKEKIIGLCIGIMVLGSLIIINASKSEIVPYEQNNVAPVSTTTVVATTSTLQQKPIQSEPVATPEPASLSQPTETPVPTKTVEGYTAAQVALHGNKSDCWSSVNGKVYNLTEWIDKHPGGEREIISMCGKDGSKAFNSEHGGDNKPEKILAGFYIGELIQ